MNKQEIRRILIDSKFAEILTFKKVLILQWWEWFNKSKFNYFVESIKDGKTVRLAFIDAKLNKF